MAQFKVKRRTNGYAFYTETFIVEADDFADAVEKVECEEGATCIETKTEFEDESDAEYEDITE